MAVATSASAMPGATLARLACCRFDRPVNACMIPQTVPKRPMYGLTEPTEARKFRRASSPSISRWYEARIARRAPSSVACASPRPRSFRNSLMPASKMRSCDARLSARIRGLLIELLQLRAAPELTLELLGFAFRPLDREALLEDRRPRSDRQQRQQQHDELHDDGRLGDQRENREVAGRCHCVFSLEAIIAFIAASIGAGIALGASVAGIHASRAHQRRRQHVGAAPCGLLEHHRDPAGLDHANVQRDHIVEPRRPQVVALDPRDHELQRLLRRQVLLPETRRA